MWFSKKLIRSNSFIETILNTRDCVVMLNPSLGTYSYKALELIRTFPDDVNRTRLHENGRKMELINKWCHQESIFLLPDNVNRTWSNENRNQTNQTRSFDCGTQSNRNRTAAFWVIFDCVRLGSCVWLRSIDCLHSIGSIDCLRSIDSIGYNWIKFCEVKKSCNFVTS